VHRRTFLAGTGAVLLAAPLGVEAQQQAPVVIGFLSSRSPGESATGVEAFRQGLNEEGYVEGRNVVIEFRWADGQYDRLPPMASELVRRQVALIVAAGGVVRGRLTSRWNASAK
jgi:ABC-type uncharacterized transport system substrate-binding protein